MTNFAFFIFTLVFSLFNLNVYAGPNSCEWAFKTTLPVYQAQQNILNSNNRQTFENTNLKEEATAFATKMPILRTFEKEGLYYEEIAEWFPDVKPYARRKLNEAFYKATEAPRTAKTSYAILRWLETSELNPLAPIEMRAHWDRMTSKQKWDALSTRKDFFLILTLKSRSALFENQLLTFDDMVKGPNVPPHVIVGDDLGSYEIRLAKAIPDRNEFHKLRDDVEEFLNGKVGHQHLFHKWPDSPGLRKYMAPYYIELVDSATWFLFWRQMKRNPENTSSLLNHPYLGVYSTNSLDRLNRNVENGYTKGFNDKFRMVGARSFPPMADYAADQGDAWVPDWEIRSGNKGVKRDFVESLLEARLVTGDYSGLKDYRDSGFTTLMTVKELCQGYLSPQDIGMIETFQSLHPKMEYSIHGNTKNHYRTRIMSPLLPWAKRLDLRFKNDILREAQQEYAKGLAKIARSYVASYYHHKLTPHELGELNTESIEKFEDLMYAFASKVRLDLDFERYLQPTAKQVPSILVKSTAPINVNKIDLGIEYSFRFPAELRPQTKTDAQGLISRFAQHLSQTYKTESQTTEMDSGARPNDSHGHGLVIKYLVQDPSKQTWRVEWDGIRRTYENGQVVNAWGGHIEVVTPKFSPQKLSGPITDLYASARKDGMAPNRSAGGAHVNFDIEALKAMPNGQGTRALLNLVTLFENNRDVILQLWQHPNRKHAAYPVEMTQSMRSEIENFSGSWKELGRMLYEIRYFNVFVSRKPKYVPINLTALMTDIVPPSYMDKTLDIKNPQSQWFPNFNKVYNRGEARFFDAPKDEVMAALQIKYWRALMNKAFSDPNAIRFVTSPFDKEALRNDAFVWRQAVEAHLTSLGLDPAEFQSLIWDSFVIHHQNTGRDYTYEPYRNFLPSVP